MEFLKIAKQTSTESCVRGDGHSPPARLLAVLRAAASSTPAHHHRRLASAPARPPVPARACPCRYWQITKRITATKGIAGTLDGFVPWGMLQAVAKGAVFSWGQAQSASLLHESTFLTKEQKTVASGGMGGFVQGIVLSPLLLLKTRVMTDPAFRNSGGLLETAAASFKVRACECVGWAKGAEPTRAVWWWQLPRRPARRAAVIRAASEVRRGSVAGGRRC